MPQRLVLLVLLFAMFYSAPSRAEETASGYQWQQVGDGVFQHTRSDPFAGPVDGNSVVIVTGDAVVVVDTHINPAAARAVIAKIGEITDLPVTHVINSHWHDDHTNGNHAFRDAFPDVKIIAHRDTLKALKKEWPKLEEQRLSAYGQVNADELRKRADELQASDPLKANSYRVYAGYVEALMPELPKMQLIYPDTVFGDSFELGTGDHRISIHWLGRGNTDGDVIVWLPGQKILITGDLLVAPVPYAFDSPMVDWIDTLERLKSYQPETIIPGHGAVQDDTAYLDQVIALLRTTVGAVRAAHDNGVAFGDLHERVALTEQEQLFSNGEVANAFAWRSYFVEPGLESAWASLGYPVPE